MVRDGCWEVGRWMLGRLGSKKKTKFWELWKTSFQLHVLDLYTG